LEQRYSIEALIIPLYVQELLQYEKSYFVMQRQTCCIWRHQLGWGSLMLKVAPPMRLWMMRQQVIYLPVSIALELCSFYYFFNLLRQISSSSESFFKSYLLSKKARTLHMMFRLLKSWDKTAISAKNATQLLHDMINSLWLFIPRPYIRMLLFWFNITVLEYTNSYYSFLSSEAVILISQARDNLVFLQRWFNKFPQFRNRDLFLAGESYAGMHTTSLFSYHF